MLLFEQRIENTRYVRDISISWYEIKLRDFKIHLLTKISYNPNKKYKPNFVSFYALCPTSLDADLVPIRQLAIRVTLVTKLLHFFTD